MPRKIKALAVGAVRKGWPIARPPPDELPRLKGDTEEKRADRRNYLERRAREFEGVSVDVRLLPRADVQDYQAELDVAWARMLEEAPSAAEGESHEDHRKRVLAAKAKAEAGFVEACRGLLRARVLHPRTGKDLGPALHKLNGVELELEDGSVQDLSETELEETIEGVEHIGWLGDVTFAVLGAMRPKEEQRGL